MFFAALQWFLLYMLHYQDVQHRCQKELDDSVGSSRQVALADRPNLPYIEATLHEIMRLANITPFPIPHSTDRETTLGGYTLPAGTLVLINSYAVHMDPALWEEPEEFRPERWLGPSGGFQKRDGFVAFSAGPRVCLGEGLARNEMFLIFCSLLQRFSFRMVDTKVPPPLEGELGVTLSPYAYQFVAEAR